MKIKANNREIEVSSVVSSTISRNGKKYPALRFIFGGGVSDEDITALTSGSITINGNKHKGYNTLDDISVTVGAITTAEEERDAIQAEHAEMKESVNMILPMLDDETALSVVSLFPEWVSGRAYTTGERIVYGGKLYRVVQDHTSQADWLPDSTPSLYDAIVISASGYDAWAQPTGAHDAYNTGDIVEYNGTLYKSTIDGNTYAPDSYPGGWEIYSE